MKRKNNSLSKVGVIFLVSIMALTVVGAGYSAWFDTITVHGTVSTGSVEWGVIDYSGTYVWKIWDPDYTGEFSPEYGTEIYVTGDPNYDPTQYGATTGFERVAYAEATPGAGEYDVDVIFDNLFPCIWFKADIVIKYTGTIPGKINDIIYSYTPEDDWVEPLIASNDIYAVAYDESGDIVDLGYQLHENDLIFVELYIHIPQNNDLMLLSGGFTASFEVIQWNEYEEEQTEDITGDWILRFHLGGGNWDHDMTITSQDAAGNIQGVGGYPAGGPYSHAWTLTGLVTGDQIQFTIIYQTGNPGYTVWAQGTISPGGTYMSGTWDSSAGQQGTWETL